MRNDESVVSARAVLREVLLVMTNTRGRPGCAAIVDADGRLVGVFTDGDLRRLLEHGEAQVDRPIGEMMSAHPATVGPDDLVSSAAEELRRRRIDQVVVVDAEQRPVGLLDIQDLLAARFL